VGGVRERNQNSYLLSGMLNILTWLYYLALLHLSAVTLIAKTPRLPLAPGSSSAAWRSSKRFSSRARSLQLAHARALYRSIALSLYRSIALSL